MFRFIKGALRRLNGKQRLKLRRESWSYLADIIRKPEDLRNQRVLDLVYRLARSKFAIMDGSGYVATIGEFVNERGLLFSNRSYTPEGRL